VPLFVVKENWIGPKNRKKNDKHQKTKERTWLD